MNFKLSSMLGNLLNKLVWCSLTILVLFALGFATQVCAQGSQVDSNATSDKVEALTDTADVVKNSEAADTLDVADTPARELPSTRMVTRATLLVGSLTVFLLAVFVGFEVITKVPPTLHTPLMSGSNAISGITVVGAILMAGSGLGLWGSFLGMIAVVLATINVVGGFVVTQRMLMKFKKR